jgi:DNA invertase Pin-like site-specific DNA recombinase
MGQLLEALATPKPLDPLPFSAIFIDDISRIARNLAFTILFVQLLRFHGISLYDSKGVDYTTIQGYCLAILLGIVAEIGRVFLCQQTSRGVRAAIRRNRKPGTLFGFRPASVKENDNE